MKLPNYENAIIAEAKIVQYLLNKTHPYGKDKADFFSRFGFSVAEWNLLADALLAHVAENEVASTFATPEGIHYAVEGELETPDGRKPHIRAIWAIDTVSDIPRFITAYPLKPRKDNEHDKRI
jgi:hypothetical protein